jgi:hypothetical protein
MVLARAPARAAVYGLVFGVGSIVPRVTVTVDGGAPIEAVVEPGLQGASPSANACDRSCFDAGHLSVGAISCCNQPSCAMGCIFAARFPSEAACSAQCAAARNASSCSYTPPGMSWAMDMCEACPPSGCPAKAECEAGCAAFFAPAQAPMGWKALLPPMPAGGASTIVVACASGCAAGAVDPAPLERVAFGEVVYCRCAIGTHARARERASASAHAHAHARARARARARSLTRSRRRSSHHKRGS